MRNFVKLISPFRSHLWLGPVLIFAVLVILGAKMHPLWGDEAETALFARNILSYGIPRGWDDTNIMGLNDAIVLNSNLVNYLTSWGQYYLTATSFAIFGQSSFSARLPFVILSILSIPILFKLTLKLTEDKKTALISVLITCLSVPFILFSFQARYYSLITFAGITFVYTTLSLSEKRLWPKFAFVLAGTSFFYGNYALFVGFYISTLLSCPLYLAYQKKTLKQIINYCLNFAGLSLLIAILCAPWYFILKPFENNQTLVLTSLGEFIGSVIFFFTIPFQAFNEMGVFPWLFIPLSIFVIISKFTKKQNVGPFIVALGIPLIYFIIMSILTQFNRKVTYFIDDRYLIVVFPYLALTAALLINEILVWKKPVGILVLVIFIFTNFFSLLPPRLLIPEYLEEIKESTPTPNKEVADYLISHAKDGDTAYLSLDRNHEPLIFHLGKKIRFVNRILPTNNRIFPKNRGLIPRYIYDFRDKPDWIILYGKMGAQEDLLTFDYRPIPPQIDLKKDYTEITLPIYFSDMTRPEINRRPFTKIISDPIEFIYIYQLKK